MTETRESWVCRWTSPISGVVHERFECDHEGSPISALAAAEMMLARFNERWRNGFASIVEVQHSPTEWRRYRVTCRVVRQYSAEEVT